MWGVSVLMQIGWLVDGCILGFLILQTFLGWRRGLLWQVAGVTSVGFGVVLGWALAPNIGSHLMENITSDPFHAKLTAFLFVLGLVGFTLRLAAAWAEVHAEKGLPKEERERRRADDRILGGIFGALKGSVLALVFVAAGVALFPKSDIWQQSKLATPLAIAGSRLLPEGAVQEVTRWAGQSAAEMRQGLNIQ